MTPAAALLWAICLATLLAFPLIRGFPTPRPVRRRVAECLVIGFALVASIAWFVVVVVTW